MRRGAQGERGGGEEEPELGVELSSAPPLLCFFASFIATLLSHDGRYRPGRINRAGRKQKTQTKDGRIRRVSLIRGKHIVANSTHEPWVEADGEIIGPLPMTFDIVPDALSVIVPRSEEHTSELQSLAY